MRLKTAILIALAVLLAIPASILAIAVTHDFSDYKSEVASAVKDLTGRNLVIDGSFKLELGLTPALVARNVRFANAPWGSRREMATARRFELQVALMPLLQGRIEVRRLTLVGADVLLETSSRGVGNWILQRGGGGKSGSMSLALGNIRFRDAKVVYRDGRTGNTIPVDVKSLSSAPLKTGPNVRVELAAVYREHPFSISGTIGRFTRESDDTSPWPVDIVVRTAGTELKANGRMRAPFEPRGLDAQVDLVGPDLSRLNEIIGTQLPAIGPYRVAGRLRETNQSWSLAAMQASVGETEFAGEVSVGLRSDPARVRASVATKTLDVDELAPHLDLRAQAAAKPADKPAGKRRLFDDTRFDPDLPRHVDAEVALRADKLRFDGVEFEGASLTAALDDRLIVVRPLRLGLAGGEVTGEVTVDERTGMPKVTAALVGRGLEATRLLRGAAIAPFIKGRFDIAADVKTAGTTSRALAKGLVGKVGLEMGTGQLDNGYFNVLSGDVLQALIPWAPRQEAVKINCVMAIFDLQQGVGTSRVALLDTSRATMVADGTANLLDETMSFAVWPRAKDVSLMRLMVPLRVSGPLTSPSVFPDPARLVPGAVGIATGILEGLGSLIGIGGEAKGVNRCRAALAAVMKKSGGDRSSTVPRGLFPDGPSQ
jgi:uncharacterized protein involved in outer membrane biogenesis